MKNNLKTALAALACAAIAVALAPTSPTATAGVNGHHGHHYDEEARQWYDFAHDKGIEINHILIRTHAAVERKTEYAVDHILYFCDQDCPTREVENRYKRIRKTIARKAKFKIGKCIWEAQMDLEACYTDARAQLEAAGYDYFLPYIYNPFRHVQGELVDGQRYANMHLDIATYCGSW